MIPFNNLKPLYTLLQDELNAATQRVLQSGWFILGPEVEAFENAFAAYHGARIRRGNDYQALILFPPIRQPKTFAN